ncbi:MAG: hypothetical protein VR64_17690 [Desulfatitalea sp. BRH_c12]|nr:MAG: hypothetical protein VR64_17690 [Desulfatitalea sp. BRH_c12]
MFTPRQIPPEERLNRKQRVVVVLMNVLLLIELTISMYLGQQDPANLTVVFLKTFLPMCVVTMVASRIVVRRLQANVPARVE